MTTDLSGYGVHLKPVTKEHLEQLRQWRNDPLISQFMLSQEEITEQQQRDWFEFIGQIKYQQHFVIYYREAAIGAANIKEQNQQPIIKDEEPTSDLKIEPGIYLGDERFRSNVLAFAPSLLLLDYCFEALGVSTLYARVHENNHAALNYNRKLGYREVTTVDGWVAIELTKTGYHQATAAIKQFLSRR